MGGLRGTMKSCSEIEEGNQISSVAKCPSREMKPEQPQQAWSVWKRDLLHG